MILDSRCWVPSPRVRDGSLLEEAVTGPARVEVVDVTGFQVGGELTQVEYCEGTLKLRIPNMQ